MSFAPFNLTDSNFVLKAACKLYRRLFSLPGSTGKNRLPLKKIDLEVLKAYKKKKSPELRSELKTLWCIGYFDDIKAQCSFIFILSF